MGDHHPTSNRWHDYAVFLPSASPVRTMWRKAPMRPVMRYACTGPPGVGGGVSSPPSSSQKEADGGPSPMLLRSSCTADGMRLSILIWLCHTSL